ncbi:hypothetical protein [Rhodovibrio salinarum]|uniref:Uncharacterized protein n=1 Tax=Rhodovibrio salinarum TaxID=1087 RepID=A0A934V0N0_9PROT|nr:hypothetical protein [Rhodovibrio salinarum]MBK1698098.1 hypothetical protein [Rhodovibrio salinarum]
MKLSDNQVKAVEEQTGLQPIPEDNPAMDQLKENFGDHTFYVDDRGLYILETPQEDTAQSQATAVQVAQWTDENRNALQAHEPQATDAVFSLTPGEEGTNNANGAANDQGSDQ